jgi:hypothetical protein
VPIIRVSPFEQRLIDAALMPGSAEIAPGTAVVLMPDLGDFIRVFQDAVSPALRDCGFSAGVAEPAFDSHGWISDISRFALGAEIILADVTACNPDVMYALGLCHGLGRSPLMFSRSLDELPFNLDVVRCIRYSFDSKGLRLLREELTRAVRVVLAEATASRQKQDDYDST